MNLQILFCTICFVIAVLTSYEAWHSKYNTKLYSIAFMIGAICELLLIFLSAENLKL